MDRRGAELWVVERHGWRGFDSRPLSTHQLHALAHHAEAFRRRARHFQHAEHGFAHAQELVSRAVDDLGVDRACDLFFSAERQYWQRRNRAGQVQKGRQDRLGLGWANHDHHTYRSSRRYFSRLISVLEQLGFECRERFYGGRDAGWGAQVLEQPTAGIVIFADVDLTPEEVTGDFAHQPMPAQQPIGHRRTVVRAARRGVSRSRHAPPGMPVRFRRRSASNSPQRRHRDRCSRSPIFPICGRLSPRPIFGPSRRTESTSRWKRASSRPSRPSGSPAKGRSDRTWRFWSGTTATRVSTRPASTRSFARPIPRRQD